MSEKNQFDFPTQVLDLPSKGLLYPESHPLASGQIEILMPSAIHEDILTNAAYLKQGIVFDKLLKAVIVNKSIDIDDMLIGDQDAIFVAFRVLAFGGEYAVKKDGEVFPCDLSKLDEKVIDPDIFKRGENEFPFLAELSKVNLTFKLLTRKDEKAIGLEIDGSNKVATALAGDVTTRLKHTITSVNGDRSTKTIREYVDRMPIRDSRALRSFINTITPGYNMKFNYTRPTGDVVEDIDIPMTVDFFWPK